MGVQTYLQAFLALAVVVGLIMGMAWLLRRYGLGDAAKTALGRKKRIAALESATVDARHKLVLVRRDDIEHLLLIGPTSAVVVEKHIPTPPAQSELSDSLEMR